MSELNKLPRSRPRIPAKVDPNTSSVRRSLFGPVDHEATQLMCRQECQKLIDEENNRWNFDFEKGTPLDGQYKWEELGSTSDVIHQSYECARLPYIKLNTDVSTECPSIKSVINEQPHRVPCASPCSMEICDTTLVTGEIYHVLPNTTKSKSQPKITGK